MGGGSSDRSWCRFLPRTGVQNEVGRELGILPSAPALSSFSPTTKVVQNGVE